METARHSLALSVGLRHFRDREAAEAVLELLSVDDSAFVLPTAGSVTEEPPAAVIFNNRGVIRLGERLGDKPAAVHDFEFHPYADILECTFSINSAAQTALLEGSQEGALKGYRVELFLAEGSIVIDGEHVGLFLTHDDEFPTALLSVQALVSACTSRDVPVSGVSGE